MLKRCIGSLTALLLSLGVAEAAPITFFGEDAGLGESLRLPSHSSADAARASFFGNLTGVGTESFESFPAFTGTPLGITFPGAGTATLQTAGQTRSQPTGTNGAGRYPISGNIYWQVSSSSFQIAFSGPVAAFGFYGVDIGDFGGQLTLDLQSGTTSTSLTIPNTINGPGGSVLYFGVIDTLNPFDRIVFGNSEGRADFFGFDDFSIGSAQQVQQIQLQIEQQVQQIHIERLEIQHEDEHLAPTPEPGTLLLLGSGLASLAIPKRRRK